MKTTALIALALLAAACSNRNGDYDASGTFEATEVIVSAEGNGRIERFDVEEGQRLTAGEVVGSIDSIQLYLKKLQLKRASVRRRAAVRTLPSRSPQPSNRSTSRNSNSAACRT